MSFNYKLNRWRHKREMILRRDSYLCQRCKRFGRMTQASHVHHIYPVEDFPDIAFEGWNLTSLCNACHDLMHVRSSHQLTDEGRRLQLVADRRRAGGTL